MTDPTIPADATTHDVITWACDQLDAMHPLATFAGDRCRTLTRTIRDAANTQRSDVDRLTKMLEEELTRQDEER